MCLEVFLFETRSSSPSPDCRRSQSRSLSWPRPLGRDRVHGLVHGPLHDHGHDHGHALLSLGGCRCHCRRSVHSRRFYLRDGRDPHPYKEVLPRAAHSRNTGVSGEARPLKRQTRTHAKCHAPGPECGRCGATYLARSLRGLLLLLLLDDSPPRLRLLSGPPPPDPFRRSPLL